MYHISKDKRAELSAELIYKGLLKCLKKKHFEDITISDLQRVSTVARTTFYRSFDTISDVLYWKCDLSFFEVLSTYSAKQFVSEYDLAKHYFSYWMTHSDILELLIKINRYDIIYECHMKNAELLHKRYGEIPEMTKTFSSYFMAIRTGFTISILTAWLVGGRKENLKQIMEIIRKNLEMLEKSK